MSKKCKVRILVDGERYNFTVVGKTKKGVLKIYQNEGLLSSEFCEAVRKLGRWPRKDELLDENSIGTPCFRHNNEIVVNRSISSQ